MTKLWSSNNNLAGIFLNISIILSHQVLELYFVFFQTHTAKLKLFDDSRKWDVLEYKFFRYSTDDELICKNTNILVLRKIFIF